MPIESTRCVSVYVADGRRTEYPVGFRFCEKAHLRVYLSETEDFSQTLPTDGYDVVGESVVFPTAPPAGTSIRIERKTAATQTTNYQENDRLPAESLNYSLDKVTMMVQELQNELGQVAKLDPGDENVQALLERIKNEALVARDIALDASVSSGRSAQLSMLGAKAVANIWTRISGDPDKSNAMLKTLLDVSEAAGAVAAAAAAAKNSIADQKDEVEAALGNAAAKQKAALDGAAAAFDDQLEELLSARIAEANGASETVLAALSAASSELSLAVQRAQTKADDLFADAEAAAQSAIDRAQEKLEEMIAAGNATQAAIESQRLYTLKSIYQTLFDAEYDAEQTFHQALAGLYQAVDRLFGEDGVVTEKEQEILDRIDLAVAEAVSGDAGALAQIQQFVAAVIAEDGVLSTGEAAALEAIAAARQAADNALAQYKQEADASFASLTEQMNQLFAEDGILSAKEQEFLTALEAAKQQVLSSASTEALQELHDRMEGFFAEDGTIDQREEEILRRIDQAIANAELQVAAAMGAVRLRLIALREACETYFATDGISADEQGILDRLASGQSPTEALALLTQLQTDLASFFGASPDSTQSGFLARIANGGEVSVAARTMTPAVISSFRADLSDYFGGSPGTVQTALLALVDSLIGAATPTEPGEVYARSMAGYKDRLQGERDTLAASFGTYPYSPEETALLAWFDQALKEIDDSTLGQQRTQEARLAEIQALLEEYFGEDGTFDAREQAILDAIQQGGAAALESVQGQIEALFAEDGEMDQREQEILDRYRDLVNGRTSLDAFQQALLALWPDPRTQTQQDYLDLAAAARTAALKGDATKLESLETVLVAYFGESPSAEQTAALQALATAIQTVRESALYTEREELMLEQAASRIAALDAALAANRASGYASGALGSASAASGAASASQAAALSAAGYVGTALAHAQNAAASAAQAQAISEAMQQALDNLDPEEGLAAHNESALAHAALRARITALESAAGNTVSTLLTQAFQSHNADQAAHAGIRESITALSGDLGTQGTRITAIEEELALSSGDNGYLVVWGTNGYGQSGSGHKKVIYSPECLAYPEGVTRASFYDKGGVAIFGGRLYVTGENTDGFTGPGRSVTIGWQRLADLSGWTRGACGLAVGAAIRNNALFTWGNGTRGAGGRGDTVARWLPSLVRRRIESGTVPAEFADDWTDVTCGPGFTLALTSGGNVYATGRNNNGQLGLGDSAHRYYFTKLPFTGAIQKIAAGGSGPDSYAGFCAAIDATGKLFTWGSGADYRSGRGTTAKAVSPVQLSGTWTDVACGYRHMAAVGSDGKLYVAGSKTALGQSANVTTLTPLAFNFGTITGIACGLDCTFVVNSLGHVYSFGGGSSGNGKLGWNTTANQPTPKKIAENASAVFGGSTNYGGAFVTDQFRRDQADSSDTSNEDTTAEG